MQHKICNNSHNLEKRHLTLLRCPFILPLKVRAPAISEWTYRLCCMQEAYIFSARSVYV